MISDFHDARGVRIASEVLKEQGTLFDEPLPELWLILDSKFVPDDNLPRYYSSEIPILRNKNATELRDIHKFKETFLGSRIRA